ncbi:chaplin [Streptomyces sclerotialus]|uniref:chaplin n=1 Tax=Streptomyces sclerotialus TaxID=1957 RepID=UPI00099C0F5E
MSTVALGAVALMAADAGTAAADSTASNTTSHSPGVLNAYVRQYPIHIPVSGCGITGNIVGLLDPAFGAACQND